MPTKECQLKEIEDISHDFNWFRVWLWSLSEEKQKDNLPEIIKNMENFLSKLKKAEEYSRIVGKQNFIEHFDIGLIRYIMEYMITTNQTDIYVDQNDLSTQFVGCGHINFDQIQKCVL